VNQDEESRIGEVMDLETQKMLSENGFRPRGTNFYHTGCGLTGDPQEEFLLLKDRIYLDFKLLSERKKETLEIKLRIGKNATAIQRLIENHNSGMARHKRSSIKTVFAECFGERAGRIYEAIAMCRAISEGMSQSAPSTTLIRVGEKLGNAKTAEKMKKAISSDSIMVDGTKAKFSELTQKEIFKSLKGLNSKPVPEPSYSDVLQSFAKQIGHLVDRADEVHKKFDWKNIKGNQVRLHFSKVEDEIERLVDIVEQIKTDCPGISRPNLVSKTKKGGK
jgi:hypothetical protein